MRPSTVTPDAALLTVDQVATRLSCHANSVRTLLASGALPAVRLGRHLRVAPSALEAFIAAGGAPRIRGTNGE